jgi:hypothetical protein
MPHVLNDPDVLEEHTTTLSPEYDTLPLERPTAPRGCSRLQTFLHRLITLVPRLRPRRQDHCHSGEPRVETALDILARERPDTYLLVMGGMV